MAKTSFRSKNLLSRDRAVALLLLNVNRKSRAAYHLPWSSASPKHRKGPKWPSARSTVAPYGRKATDRCIRKQRALNDGHWAMSVTWTGHSLSFSGRHWTDNGRDCWQYGRRHNETFRRTISLTDRGHITDAHT